MISLMYSLILASILFVIGLLGVMIRRNLYFLLLSLMVMNNGAIVALVSASSYWQQSEGQLLAILAVVTVLAQACVGLALLMKLIYRRKIFNIDSLSEMKG
ncbi:NADH-quinone oxidoreductase subunit NuoK [Gilliamella sp. B2776]|uniref:NADH-quinone oxidoreductase subunit NuoK n=1 Tax=unclassified Gilliamella TaxID=2685620 RepID=UPI00226AB9E1|nr:MULTISPECIES: NADH-quinone oxidoreductase subunit NuoK [unclassified Gilliamella]MCX8648760.1 NADH-quinone oxidoreductase subunit NuoK [Gilliamella sp. B2779]MCX8653364.1 NADH-quinone oxidoreductase subunit NuoK [Gilliamella sp. B2737]MCX8655640.1 NADH-quinone oxidoreductase subunit NuoK [Gilliamella sp. B2894]MCX8690572.1 NADH-quinone oxidoreductase subunit NuoK [Gilliamella sp. B2776]MCX8694775.1 NADH-quinone oxidoreductase subunit NuoK [Gilliamella sp. B2881]MCX8701730.1 NADH-quinone ox